MPCWLLLWNRNLQARSLRLRVQVSRGLTGTNQVPAALLLPQPVAIEPDSVPHRIQVRRCGQLQRDQVPTRHFRILCRQGDLRRLPCRPVLPGADELSSVPGEVLLPGGVVGANHLSGQLFLPAWLGGPGELPGREEVWDGRAVSERLQIEETINPDGCDEEDGDHGEDDSDTE